MKNSIKATLDKMHLSDIYSLMLFILYKLQDIPDYAVLSELCYLLDGSNLTRLLAYFSGKTITFPTQEEFTRVSNALLLYQFINLEGNSVIEAQARLGDLSIKQQEEVMELYLKLIPIINSYNIDRGQIKHEYKS